MKFYYFLCIQLLFLYSCTPNNDDNDNPAPCNNLQDLGLSSNNSYPYYPITESYLSDNYWFDNKVGDTLTISRRDAVSDDSGDMIYYTFLVRKGECIKPLKVKCVSSDAYSDPPMLNYEVYNKPITDFSLQTYDEDQLLACKIVTIDSDNPDSSNLLIDKMWINLND